MNRMVQRRLLRQRVSPPRVRSSGADRAAGRGHRLLASRSLAVTIDAVYAHYASEYAPIEEKIREGFFGLTQVSVRGGQGAALRVLPDVARGIAIVAGPVEVATLKVVEDGARCYRYDSTRSVRAGISSSSIWIATAGSLRDGMYAGFGYVEAAAEEWQASAGHDQG